MQRPGTYQTRIRGYSGVGRAAGDAALSAYAELFGRVQRKLFAQGAAGRLAALLKSRYLKQYGIPAGMFNAVRFRWKARFRRSGSSRSCSWTA